MKNNWMLFLLGFSMFLSSCNKNIDSEFIAKYIYQNKSNNEIEFVLMGEIVENEMVIEEKVRKYIIAPNNTIIFEIAVPTNSKIVAKPIGILKQNNFLGDSVQINFDSMETLTFYKDVHGRDSIYLESNYFYSQTGDYSVEFLFQLNR